MKPSNLQGSAFGKHAQRDSIPPYETTGKTGLVPHDGAHSGARDRVDDSWLARLIEVWPSLSDVVRGEILAMAGLRPDDVDDLNDVAASVVHHEGTPT